MNETQARTFFEARSGYTQRISRRNKAGLAIMYRDDLAEQGEQILFGGPVTKQEFISALVELHYPLAQMNEASHVLYHGEFANDACAYCNPDPCPICGALEACAYTIGSPAVVNGRHADA